MTVTRSILKIGEALIFLAVCGYLAYTMYNIDHLQGRQFRIVILIASVMTGIFGKIIAAVITAVIGIAGCFFLIVDKDDEGNKDKIVESKKV
ncbi:hypothetical protein [Chitinophaga barathri]|uniref:Uncharacterized protein n=1 Tax=Chitinophaga barathri TaxID=1647451 RepID=A0A3N4MW59_9BACT|nr:hypothetical protein [Chitinophaga barathri]RPD39633.1 hypothetical protein EG028_18480 [Chitinophaga barathri]